MSLLFSCRTAMLSSVPATDGVLSCPPSQWTLPRLMWRPRERPLPGRARWGGSYARALYWSRRTDLRPHPEGSGDTWGMFFNLMIGHYHEVRMCHTVPKIIWISAENWACYGLSQCYGIREWAEKTWRILYIKLFCNWNNFSWRCDREVSFLLKRYWRKLFVYVKNEEIHLKSLTIRFIEY